MKARTYPVVLSLVFGLAFSSSLRSAEAESSHVFVDPADPAVREIRRLGERTVDQAGGLLVMELRRVLADTTPAMAIGVMHLKDFKLPASTPGGPVATELRRTSLQVRNPANAPDAADRAALELLKAQREQGEPLARILVQQITRPGQPDQWRVYRPLGVMTECLRCHGSAGDLAPGVADALKIFYPQDAAVNYKEGDWRGLIRATIVAAPAAK